MIVNVREGKLEGTTNKSVLTGKEYYSFLGIRYAKPPIGDLRFQPPVPIEKWNGILDAKNEGSPCIQYTNENIDIIGSEDCLFLNIHTPEAILLLLPSKIKIPKPVMVFIHGGAFVNGSGGSKTLGPDYLIIHDVVYVTLNYRLHSLGFLNLGISECSGNCGLKDQLLALKWIKENINQFGGDRNNITIFGESAGAISVHLHMLSPLSKGIFSKTIAQSGTALVSFSLNENPTETAFKLGRELDFVGNDPKEFVEFLKNQSAENLLKAAEKTQRLYCKELIGTASPLIFAPSIEVIKNDAFLPDHPKNLLKTAEPLPFLVGLNDKEGRLIYSVQSLQEDFSIVIKQNIPCHYSKIKELSDKVQKFYFGDKPICSETDDEISNLYTDLYFLNLYESFQYITKSNFPVYIYEFSFYGKFNVFSQRFMKNATTGASHADELPYLFYSNKFCKNISEIKEPEKTVINNICSMWTNFAKTGNPTDGMKDVEWKPSTFDNPRYLQINKDLTLKEGKIFEKRFSFLKNIYEFATEYPPK
ncbi:hypothetical protein PGB90_005498 [Kerria lacca]